MKISLIPELFVLILSLFMTSTTDLQATDKQPNSSDTIMKRYGVPSYAGLNHLCNQRIYSVKGTHIITWDAFSSRASPAKLVAYYLNKIGKEAYTREESGGTWRLPVESLNPETVLSIIPHNKSGPHEACKKKLPTGAQSIVIVSKMM